MTPAPKAAIMTLGCKLNQYESEQIREQLARLGYEVVDFDESADLYVINSCTVTGRTDRDCRRLARRAKRRNPAAIVVMAGCYAQASPDELREIPEIDLILDNEHKVHLENFLGEAGALPGDFAPGGSRATTGPCTPAVECDMPDYADGAMVAEFAAHTRAFVKVQEGCDAACTYCVIPRARGHSRSVPVADVLEQCRRLVAAGHPEIVLIGTHLGRYNDGTPDSPDLAGLCRIICAQAGVQRVRLSSIEPREVTDQLAQLIIEGGRALSGEGKLCRHLHVPMQSGCDAILRRMNRPYGTRYYGDLVRRLYDAQPGICVGADVMVGFPGETDDEFEQTRAFIESLPLAYLHVFTYSRRSGTPAAQMPDQVDYEVKIARNHILRDLSEVKRAAFAQAMVGQTLEVVVERRHPDLPEGFISGVADNYLQVTFAGESDLIGRIIAVHITTADCGELRGEIA